LFEQANLGSNIHANLRLASFYVAREDFAAAVARVEQALKIDATDYSARLFYGTLKIFLGDYHLAIVSLRIATEERPNSAAAFTNMAVAYLRLQKPDRALVCLKRAVALDPLSSTAVALLADVANTLDVSEDAVPALRYFVRFEQQSAAIWARLGRALIHMQEYGEAIAALKRESSVTDAPDLWNNMGVAHFLRGDKKKAGEAFVHAMRISGDPKTYAFCLAAKNAAAVLMQSGEPEGALKLVDIALREDNRYLILHRDDLAQLILIKLDALTRLKEVDSANEFAEHLLGMEEASLQLKGWVASGLLTQYALRDDRKQQAVLLAEEWLGLVDSLPTRKQRVQVLNNVAFSFIEGGLLQQGEAALSKISFAIHREPYPTATLGLLHLRRGRIERARDLYSEAVMLCSTSDDRARIRQKWNLEEAALLLEDEPRRALKLLEKVWRDDEGEPLLRERAGRFLKSIDRNRLNLGKSGK
jgi:tetratricopeptide (TPR) repeat protein